MHGDVKRVISVLKCAFKKLNLKLNDKMQIIILHLLILVSRLLSRDLSSLRSGLPRCCILSVLLQILRLSLPSPNLDKWEQRISW